MYYPDHNLISPFGRALRDQMGKQEFLAVQCFSCGAFQVQLYKQSGKFTCSVCNAKQTTQRVFARSNLAKDVREVVQGYNNARAQAAAEAEEIAAAGGLDDWDDWGAEDDGWGDADGAAAAAAPSGRGSKWSGFADEDDVAWTVALPERTAPAAAVRGGGGGSKRKRAAQPERAAPDGDWEADPAPRQPPGCKQQQQQPQVPMSAPLAAPTAPRQALGHANQQQLPAGQQHGWQGAAGAKSWQPSSAAGQGAAAACAPGQQQPAAAAGSGGGGKWGAFLTGDDD